MAAVRFLQSRRWFPVGECSAMIQLFGAGCSSGTHGTHASGVQLDLQTARRRRAYLFFFDFGFVD